MCAMDRAGRESAKQLTQQQPREGFRWDITLFFVGVGMAIILAFLPPETRWAAILWLIALYGVLVYPVLHLAEWLLQTKRKLGVRILAVIVLACGVLAFAKVVWPTTKRHQLSESEQSAFKAALGSPSQSPRQLIQVSCPEHDEKVCMYASQFVGYFGQSGWPVRGNVERITLQRPMDGVVLIERGGKSGEELKWDAGGYTALTPDIESIYKAFRAVGITPNQSAGPDLPDGLIVAWFGEEKPDESAPTDLTRAIENLQKMRREHPEGFVKN